MDHAQPKPADPPLSTPWGEALDPDAVLPEHPRPQLVREGWLNLNGPWQYAVTAADADQPHAWDGQILVPFSPEAPLSGVGRQLQPDEALWYRRRVCLPEGFRRERVLLHFGAVDQSCTVWVNGVLAGGHDGGYLPFTLDVTAALDAARGPARDSVPDRGTAGDTEGVPAGGGSAGGGHELVVRVRDISDTGSASRGKQKLERGGIWYTAQSGIWQTVWLETVPRTWIRELVLTPAPTLDAVTVTVHADGGLPPEGDAAVVVRAGGTEAARGTARPGAPLRLQLPEPRPWSPEDPFLYDVEVSLGEDTVHSYFGLRTFGTGKDGAGRRRLLLNGQPYLHIGLLDQGYWPDGLYTAPSDEALAFDIRTARELGFTMLRKHIKIEPMRWYHHCDRLGMLVWQDMVNGGVGDGRAPERLPLPGRGSRSDRRYRKFGREDAAGREAWRAELQATVRLLRSVPSVAVWVPFNEGWGQFDAADAAAQLRRLDPTRCVDHASGWHDQGAGDMKSLHVYDRPFRVRRRWRWGRRAVVLSEYGGVSLPVPGHVFNAETFGYGKILRTSDELTEAFVRLHEEQIVPAVRQGLAATVYTQLTDVEDEVNGLLTYDRKVLKLDADAVRAVTAALRRAAAES